MDCFNLVSLNPRADLRHIMPPMTAGGFEPPFGVYKTHKYQISKARWNVEIFASSLVSVDYFSGPCPIWWSVVRSNLRTVGRSGGRTVERSCGRTVGRVVGQSGGRMVVQSGGRTVGRLSRRCSSPAGARRQSGTAGPTTHPGVHNHKAAAAPNTLAAQ